MSFPTKESKAILKTIRDKGNVKKVDFEKILELDQENQDYKITHISEHRKNLLLKILAKVPE